MTETDEYFPRGKAPKGVHNANGGDVQSTEKVSNRKSGKGVDNLFENFDRKKNLKDKKKGKKSKHALTPEEEKSLGGGRSGASEKRFAVVPLSYEQIVEGMLSLGIITKIRDHEIGVNMPGRTSGTVSIQDISSPYLKILEAHSSGEKALDDDTPIYPLREMFSIGQCVIVKVKSIQKLEGGIVKVFLTMNPKDIYSNYSTTVLKEELVMIAAVASIEDHGYQMDVGINGARCFLPKSEHDKFTKQKRPLGIGELLYCKIARIEFHRLLANIRFTTSPKIVRTQKVDDMVGINYSTLIPGMLVDTVVMETHKSGFMAYCLDLNGLVHQDHLEKEWTTAESLEVGSSAMARILYILPNLTTPYLTMQTDLLPLSATKNRLERNSLLLGAKVKARVVMVEKRGISLRLDESETKGFVPVSHLGDPTLLTVEDISKKYKANSVHECRVLHNSPVERVYLCSFRKDKLENDFVHAEQALPGKKVKCEVLRWNNGGAIVQFGSGTRGFVPNALFRSAKLSDAKKEKLIGTVHKAMIWSKEAEKDKIMLTVRKDLVKSDGAVISSIDEAKPGMKVIAIIKWISSSAVFVSTVGGAEGFIPAKWLSKIKLPNLRDVFRPGQALACKVVETNESKNQVVLTTLFNPENNSEDEEEASENAPQVKQKKDKSKRKRTHSEIEENANTNAPKSKKKKSKAKQEIAEVESEEDQETGLECEGSSFWDTSVEKLKDVDSDSDTQGPEPSKPKKKKDKKEKLAAPETFAAEDDVKPEQTAHNPDVNAELAVKYENGVIDSPNSAAYWMKLMTHYISVGNIEKARSVAKQALEMMNYRDEKGKLKVWGAWLTLEQQYGTEDTLKSTFADALQRNDQFECLKLMALVYDKAGRLKDGERIYRQMVKQFRLEPDAWIRFGTFYFQRKRCDAGRDLLNEALSAVPDNQQVFLITKFALLEFHYGEQSRGESMLDRVLTQYPFRCDVWLIYTNAFIKLGNYDGARNIFRKAFNMSWNPRKAKPLLKHFQEFEAKHGTEETMSAFQETALKTLNVTSNS